MVGAAHSYRMISMHGWDGSEAVPGKYTLPRSFLALDEIENAPEEIADAMMVDLGGPDGEEPPSPSP